MALTNHWPLQSDLLDIVGSNDGSVGAGTLAFASVSAGIQAPVFDGTFWISLGSLTVAADDADWSVFLRFTKTSSTLGRFLGVLGGNTPSIRSDEDTSIKYNFLGIGDTTETVSALGTGEHSLMLVHTAADLVQLYLDGVAAGSSNTLNGAMPFDQIGRVNTFIASGLIWDMRVFDSDERTNAATIHADIPVTTPRPESLSNLIPFNPFGF